MEEEEDEEEKEENEDDSEKLEDSTGKKIESIIVFSTMRTRSL